ncbi:transcription termination factor 2 (SNF2 family domain-containing protein) [Colletotrichum sojae]|uniref:Transcription termination factor 2 (SNF2 family domain-containing protein) n=1 Tax=Colletotrichum sojae TaxID=2175907 RepID=A0A8H6MG90_9PEZI|nr:transcription termination factor 2 (SNF2 family domain-containing protein) [Colletotrichum sojae]
MGTEADATAPGSSEKRNLPAGYDDEAAQQWKRPCISHLLQPDATDSYQTPPAENLETDLNGLGTTGWSSWEQHDPFSISGDASVPYASWQMNDASMGTPNTWNNGELPLSNFGTSWNNLQSDVGFPAVGGVGYDSEIKMESDGVMNIVSMAETLTRQDSGDAKGTNAVGAILLDTPDSGDMKETNTVGGIQLDGLNSRCGTCFGVQNTTGVPVCLKPPSEGLSRLYFEESNKYAGIVTVPALSKLLTAYTTKVTATLSTPQAPRATTDSRKKGNDTSKYRKNLEFPLRIVVYGTMEESSEIGKLLSDAGLYFQHPSTSELNMDVVYFNPHYLARPGAGMPRLDELQISSSNDSDAKSVGILDETSKARLMRVFDSADDEGITPTATASPRLQSSLKPEKELGVVENPQFPSIWERATLYDGTPTYRHRITARTDSHPFVARGGILADQYPTGKNRFETVYHGSDRQVVASNFQQNDIALTTYETMRSEFPSEGPIFAEEWFRVVLDEAHHIGNRNTMKFKAACGIQARRRWCLTGTPIQNSLDNYGALLSFIGVAPFVSKSQFDLWIANPVKQRENKRHNSWNKLQLLVRATSLRRTKKILDHSLELTAYDETIEHVDLRQSERKLYEFFRQQTAAVASGFWQQRSTDCLPGQQKDANMLSLLNLLRLSRDMVT